MYSLIYSRVFVKQLKKLEKGLQKRIISAIERIRIRPEAFVTRLVGQPYYRLRVGDYRIIIDIDKGRLSILVLYVGHRKKIYKGN